MSSLSGTSLSMYGNRLQMWGNSTGIDTQSLIEVELAMLEMKNYPIQNQKTYYTQEKQQWEKFNSTLKEFQTSLEKLKNISGANKGTTLSQEGYVSVSATKDAMNLNYAIGVQQVATAHKVLSDSQGDPTVALGKDEIVHLNEKELTITSDMSLNDVTKKINEGNYEVHASVISGTLVLTAKQTGKENEIVFENHSFFQELGFIKSDGTVKNEIQEAKDAKLTIDGVEVTSSTNSVSSAISGVTINVLRETTSPVSMTVNQDEKVLKEAVQNFVSSYNKTILAINQYTAEGAVLQGKSVITQAKSMINRALTNATDSNLMMYQLGIELDGVTRDGTIKFDESKLTNQLKDNYNGVFELLVGENGFAKQLFDKVNDLTKENGAVYHKIDGLNRSIKGLDDTLARYAESYERQQEMILNKYAKFESMMASINLQSQFMTAQLEALNGKKD